jgi:hypothetical protein
MEDLARRLPAMRRELPSLLQECDLTKLGKDGELDQWDRRLDGSRLLWKDYYLWNETWDHDHCVYCSALFSLTEPGALTAGYAIQGGEHGDDYSWLCESCVDGLRNHLSFVFVDSGEEADRRTDDREG